MHTLKNDYMDPFNQTCQVLGYSGKTIEMNRKALCGLFGWLSSKKISSVNNITTKLLRSYQSMLNDQYSTNTVIIKLRAFKHYFKFLEDIGVILINPAQELVYPITDKALPVNVLTQSEMKQLLNAPNTNTSAGIRNKAILELLYSTGIRRQECLNLQVQDTNLDEGILRINLGKGAKDRLVPLGESAVDWIRQYLKEVRAAHINPDNDHGYLFIAVLNGKPLSKEALQQITNTYGHKNLNKPVSVHTIRRSCATHMIQAGASPKFVQKLLGHSRPDTMLRYVRLVANDVRQAHHDHHPRERAIDD